MQRQLVSESSNVQKAGEFLKRKTCRWCALWLLPEVDIGAYIRGLRAIKEARTHESLKENGERQSRGDQEARRITQQNREIVRKHVTRSIYVRTTIHSIERSVFLVVSRTRGFSNIDPFRPVSRD